MSVAAATIVGQPAVGEVTFLNAAGALYDPSTVVLSSVSPYGTVTPYTYLTAPQVVRLGEGTYTLTFVPTVDGEWLVIGDATDVSGNPLDGGASASVIVSPRRGGTTQQIAAQSIVEQYIDRPLAIVTETVELYSYEDGIIQLPRRPVISVNSVLGQLGSTSFSLDDDESYSMGFEGSLLTDSEDIVPTVAVAPLPTADAAGRIADPNVLAYTWYLVTYTHGWSDANVPTIIRTVMAAVAARITANPDGVTSERIGAGYAVTYTGVGPAWLTVDEKAALAQFRPYRLGSLVTSTPIGGLP
jgi:hypothetical protein